MKILVCISHVPDTTTKIQFDAEKKNLDRAGVTYVINPYDEFGLSRAIGFREEGKSIEKITALSVGGPEVEPTLRKALAIGADEAVRVGADAIDSYNVAEQIVAYARDREYDIIFCGKESIDFNGSIVPGMIAEMLNLPFVSFATHMDITSPTQAEFKREISGGSEIVETSFPVVVSCQKGIAEWRIPNMRGIMAARKKPLSVVSKVDSPNYIETIKLDYPPAKGGCQYFEVEESGKLVDTLFEKGLI
jgi:electron transfer flavoprotein beta subunit